MNPRFKGVFLVFVVAALGAPDGSETTTALESGGPAFGSAGAFHTTDATTMSSYYNPAGLGYIGVRRIGMTVRSLPKLSSAIDGTYENRTKQTSERAGTASVTDVGLALPLPIRHGHRSGTIGLSYTTAGYLDEVGNGPAAGFSDNAGTFTIQNYVQRIHSRSDFATLAFGKTARNESISYGFGIVNAVQHSSYSESGTVTGPGWVPNSAGGAGSGWGVIAGVQYMPEKHPNLGFGLSYRSAIKLSGMNSPLLFESIPARAMAGAAYRFDGYRHGLDFLVLGAQFEHYWAGTHGTAFPMDAHSGIALGAEYHYSLGSAILPVRLGFRSIESGGLGYDARTAMTYGVGYKPNGGRYSLDLGVAQIRRGSQVFSLTGTFKF